MSTLQACLASETVGQLRERLLALPVTVTKPAQKSALIALIQSLLDLDHIKTYWKSLGIVERQAIAEVVFGPSDMFNAAQFHAKYQDTPKFVYRDLQHRCMRSTVLGAFFFSGVLPQELQERFRGFIEPPAAVQCKGLIALPEQPILWRRNMEMTALAEVRSVLKLIELQTLKMSDKTRHPSTAALNAVSAVLLGADYYQDIYQDALPNLGSIRAFAWCMLIQAGQLAQLSGSTLALTSAGKKALSAAPEDTLRQLWQGWLSTTILDEFNRIDRIKGQSREQRHLTDPVERRRVIVSALARLPVQTWVSFDEFSRFMLSSHALFKLTPGDPHELYITNPHYGALDYTGYQGWDILQARYMLCFLLEYAATLGVIDCAYVSPSHARTDYQALWGTGDLSYLSRYDGLLYFKVTNLGQYLLNQESQYQPTVPVMMKLKIEVTEAGRVKVLSKAVPSEVVVILDTFCQRQEQHRWHMTQESFLSAMDGGHALSEFQAFLLEYTVHIPSRVSTLLAELEAKSRQIRFKERRLLFECRDAMITKNFVEDRDLTRYCARVGDTVLAVPEAHLAHFQSQMRKKGYLISSSDWEGK
jgi:hypothetical protein